MTYAPWLTILLIFTRMVSFFSVIPFFNRRGIPVLLRVGVSLLMAYLLYLVIGSGEQVEGGYFFVAALARELFTGLAMGYLVFLYFVLFQMAGQMIDYKGGLMLAGVFDPQLGSQVTFLGQFYYLLALTFYLTINGHHYLFYALAESFEIVPLGITSFRLEAAVDFAYIFAAMFRMAFQISAPAVIIIFVVDIALGFIARTVPQFHVFMEGLPLKVVLSVTIIALVLPLLGPVMVDIFDGLQQDLGNLLRGGF